MFALAAPHQSRRLREVTTQKKEIHLIFRCISFFKLIENISKLQLQLDKR
jgi:hypothetical protein